MTTDPETRTLLDAAAEHLPRPLVIDAPDGAPARIIVSHPNARTEVLDLEKWAAAPRRLRQKVTFETPKAFADYVNAFGAGQPSARIFASLERRAVVAQLDYHGAYDAPSWCEHAAHYPAAFDEAFAAWDAIHDRPIPQKAFAEFLQDRAEEAIDPDPASLMEVAEKFEAIRKVDFRSVVNVSTNERQFRYEEKDAPSGAVSCPKTIRLRTPVFYGCEAFEWQARLAYDIQDGRLAFTVRIHRRAQLLDAAFERLCDGIATDCPAVPMHRGVLA